MDQLKNTKKPTGDPTCPVIVRAKRIMKKIEEKCGVEDFDDNQIFNLDMDHDSSTKQQCNIFRNYVT